MKRKYHRNHDKVAEVVGWIERNCCYGDGPLGGEPVKLEAWIVDEIITPIYGDRDEQGNRRYRTSYWEIAKGNSKSTIAALLILYELCGAKKRAAQIVNFASTSGQARIVFDAVHKIIDASPILDAAVRAGRLQKYQYAVGYLPTGSTYKYLTGKGRGKQGLTHCTFAVGDELHEVREPELVRAVIGNALKADDSHVMLISNSGVDRTTIAWKYRQRVDKLAAGGEDEPTFTGKAWSADPELPIDSEQGWRQANPNLGASVSYDMIRANLADARQSLADENHFRRFHLSQWTSASTRWISDAKWEACADDHLLEQNLAERPCVLAIDSSKNYDLCSLVKLYMPMPGDPNTLLIPHFVLPRETAERRTRDEDIPFMEWARDGYIDLHEGESISQDDVYELAQEIIDANNVVEVAYDPRYVQVVIQRLEKAGFAACIPVPQLFKLSQAIDDFDRRLRERVLRHPDNPVLNFCVENAEVVEGRHGDMALVKPSGPQSRSKNIDGVSAAVTGMQRVMLIENVDAVSVYDERGLEVI